jgi:2-hydroxychromene-2-carboxylate isomerase
MAHRTPLVINPASGVADALISAMAADGIDLGDPAEIGAWMNTFNQRPDDVRAAMLSDEIINSASPLPTISRTLTRTTPETPRRSWCG